MFLIKVKETILSKVIWAIPSGLNDRLLHFGLILTIIFVFHLDFFAQEGNILPPQTLTTEGVPALPKIFETEFKKSTDWKTSNFLGWRTNNREIIGYSEFYKPFFIKTPSGEKQNFNVFLPEPNSLAMQPVFEKSFLYTKDNDGDENSQIMKFDLDSKQSMPLTASPEIEFVNSYLWSRDGNSVYFLNQKKKENLAEIYWLNPETKEKKKLISLKGDTHFLVDVSSNYLLFSHYLSNSQTIYYFLNLKDAQVTSLGVKQAYFKEGKFSQDGKGIWYLSDTDSNYFNLYYYNLAQKKAERINSNDLNISNFAFSPNERLLALKVNESGADRIQVFEVSENRLAKEISLPEIPLGVIDKLSWRNDEEIGFGFESLKIPSEIRSFNIKTGRFEIWSKGDVNQEIYSKLEDARLIKWKSFDNREISGFLLAPKITDSTKKLPVLIDIHGGPKDQYQPYFNSYRIYSAARLQTAVIFPNIRGSSGFGKEFENLDNKEKRADALKDLQALLDWIKQQPNLDSNRVIVKGTSYGAFMAMALGIKEQARLKGVIAEVAPVAIKNYIDKSAKSLQEIYAYEYGSKTDQKAMEENENLSLLKKDNLDSWKLPLLLTAGQNDVRVPLEDIEKLKNELKNKGIPVWYLKANNEGHFWSDYENNIYLELSKIAFFIKYGK